MCFHVFCPHLLLQPAVGCTSTGAIWLNLAQCIVMMWIHVHCPWCMNTCKVKTHTTLIIWQKTAVLCCCSWVFASDSWSKNWLMFYSSVTELLSGGALMLFCSGINCCDQVERRHRLRPPLVTNQQLTFRSRPVLHQLIMMRVIYNKKVKDMLYNNNENGKTSEIKQ